MNFVASDPTIGEWRRLLRSLFADGGLFASGCTYPEFITGRHAPVQKIAVRPASRNLPFVTAAHCRARRLKCANALTPCPNDQFMRLI
jgi:hypothetical protein